MVLFYSALWLYPGLHLKTRAGPTSGFLPWGLHFLQLRSLKPDLSLILAPTTTSPFSDFEPCQIQNYTWESRLLCKHSGLWPCFLSFLPQWSPVPAFSSLLTALSLNEASISGVLCVTKILKTLRGSLVKGTRVQNIPECVQCWFSSA